MKIILKKTDPGWIFSLFNFIAIRYYTYIVMPFTIPPAAAGVSPG
jgi:hypothetical protein